MPAPTFKAVWKAVAIYDPALIRSSHCLTVSSAANTAHIFSGELEPRQPVGVDVLHIDILTAALTKTAPSPLPYSPSPRVGPTWSAHASGVYMFGGRGGTDMQPLSPDLWKYDTKEDSWEEVKDVKGDVPEGRSYHASTVLDDILYIHAGCPTEGRLSTLHGYHIPSGSWKALSSAPGVPRGGTIITAGHIDGKGVLLRFGGFGGPTHGELKDLAWYDVETDKWSAVEVKDGEPWPEARSVNGFVGLPVSASTKLGAVALLFMGEGKPAPAHLGHSGAGNFLSDVWVLTYSPSKGFKWHEAPADQKSDIPQGRGWFASDLYDESGAKGWKVIVSGGLNEKNERLGDVWILEVLES